MKNLFWLEPAACLARKSASQTSMAVLLITVTLLVGGCTGEDVSAKTSLFDHEHDLPPHTPKSLMDLSNKIRARLKLVSQSSDSARVQTELSDLIGWSAEIAADTDIGEQRWLPIYELSEELRLAIAENPSHWTPERISKTTRLCQLSEAAWQALPEASRKPRFLGHHHDHDDDHDHSDHDEHDHGDSARKHHSPGSAEHAS